MTGGESRPRIEIYSSPFCPYCWLARTRLRRAGVAFDIHPIRLYFGVKLPTRNLRDMVERTGGDASVPQVFVGGRYLGTDDTLEDLDRQGRLADILTGRSPVPGR